MWRMGLLYLDRGDSAIFAALKDAGHNTRQGPPGSPSGKFSQPTESEQAWDGKARHDALTQHGAQQWVVPADGNGIKFNPLRPKTEDPMDSLSPASDTTLFEEPEVYSLDRSKDDESLPDYFSLDGAERDQSTKSEHREPALAQRRRVRQRASSIVSAFSSVERAPLPIRARTKTNEGLLQLHLQSDSPKTPHFADALNAPKTPRSSLPVDRHRRKVSLGLPLRGITAPPEGLQRSNFDPTSTLDTPPQTPATDRATSAALKQRERDLASAALKQKERDLEYKHRHTFIGTASLDDFLEVLEVSQAYTTTKAAVARAFIILASSERLLARQASATPHGWELVSRKSSDMANIDYVAQAHIRLGSITLRQFLDLIYFDEEEEVGAMSVIEAFSAASHLDAKVDGGTGSRARAFRSWMAKQTESR